MRRAVYAGSFDPITNGHVWMIQEGAELFDELIVAIGSNPDKSYTFSMEDRTEMLVKLTSHFSNVRVDTFGQKFLVHYAYSVGARFILRGIRNEGDFHYERGMRHINHDLRPEIDTVFLMPPREIAEISSSLVKGLIGPEGWEEVVRQYVPDVVFDVIQKQFDRDRSRAESSK